MKADDNRKAIPLSGIPSSHLPDSVHVWWLKRLCFRSSITFIKRQSHQMCHCPILRSLHPYSLRLADIDSSNNTKCLDRYWNKLNQFGVEQKSFRLISNRLAYHSCLSHFQAERRHFRGIFSSSIFSRVGEISGSGKRFVAKSDPPKLGISPNIKTKLVVEKKSKVEVLSRL